MAKPKIYDVKPKAADNARNLLSIDKTTGKSFFYWNDKRFKNNHTGDNVFVIDRNNGIALFTEVNEKPIETDYNSEEDKTEFIDLDKKYSVKGEWGNFIRFKIIESKDLPTGWNWSTALLQQEICHLYTHKSSEVSKKVEKISDLKNIFSSGQASQALIEAEKQLPNNNSKNPKGRQPMYNILATLQNDLLKAKLHYSENSLARFLASCLAKRFVILTGLSGSGKTKLAQSFSYWITENSKHFRGSQVCLVPVGADWTNREPLLGYPNALEPGKYIKPENNIVDLMIEASKEENSNKPYFLILDEMNLSHVERYFADFLSAMESGEAITLHPGSNDWKDGSGKWKDCIPDKIKLSRNLFIIGTVNIDETTYMFSPKVLDRANVIEFRVSDDEMTKFLQNPVKPNLKSLMGAGILMAADFVRISEEEVSEFPNKEKINKALIKFFNELKKTGSEFGYRSASEIFRFAAVLNKLTEKEGEAWDTDDVIDAAVMQKLLPKIHGSRKKLEPVLTTLAELCLTDDVENTSEQLNQFEVSPEIIGKDTGVRFKISLEKILRMRKRVVQDGFTSFAEA